MTPAAPGLTAYLGSIPSGSAGINATLKIMVAIVRGLGSPTADPQQLAQLSALAAAVTRGCPQSPPQNECQARALFQYVRDSITYVSDPRSVETVRFPMQTLQLGAGDCDDKSLLLAALAESVGFKTRFAAWRIGADPIPTHVSAQLFVAGSGWQNAEVIPIDANGNGAPDIGWQPPDATFVRLAHV